MIKNILLEGRAPSRPFFLAYGKKLIFVAMISVFFSVPLRAAPLIVNHTCVNLYTNLTATDIARVKKMWVSLAGESHSLGYRIGCQLLNNLYQRYPVSVQESGTPEGATPNYLRISKGCDLIL